MVKILIIGNNAPDSFGYHINMTLKSMGYETFSYVPHPNFYDIGSELKRKLLKYNIAAYEILKKFKTVRQYYFRKLESIISSTNFDYIISTHDYFTHQEVSRLKQITKAKIILWYPDPVQVGMKFIGAAYDIVFLKERFFVEKIKRLSDQNIVYLPECFNPRAYSDKCNDRQEFDVATYGNLHPWRLEMLKLISARYSLATYGTPPPSWVSVNLRDINYTGRYISLDEKADELAKAKIIFNGMNLLELTSISNRIFECGGLGRFQILDNTPDFARLFGKHFDVMTYETKDEMLEKIEYFLVNEHERIELQEELRETILTGHTFEVRLNAIFEKLSQF